MDAKLNVLGKVPISEMFSAMKNVDVYALVLDGTIDQKLINFAGDRDIKYIVGMETKGKLSIPKAIQILTEADLNK